MTFDTSEKVTLKPNSARVSSIGYIGWKVERQPQRASVSAPDGTRQVAHISDGDVILKDQAPLYQLQPIRFTVSDDIPSAPEWSIVKPLPVEVHFDGDGTVVASDDVFARYGVGMTIPEALRELMDNLLIYYDIVMEFTNENRPANQALLAHLQEYIVQIRE